MDGVSVFVRHACVELTKMGHNCRIMTSLKGEETVEGVPVTRFWGFSPSFYPEHSVTVPMPWEVIWLLATFRPHVVHNFDAGIFITPITTFICWMFAIPCVVSHHTRIDLYSSYMFPAFPTPIAHAIMHLVRRGFTGFAATNLSVCNVLASHLVDHFSCRPFRVRMWHSGTDVVSFSPKLRNVSLRRELQTKDLPAGEPRDLPVVLYVGRLAIEKDISLLAPIVRLLNPPGGTPTARLVIVGRGPAQEQLMEEVKGTNTLMLGPKFGAELHEIYASCDVFLTTCTTEAGPLVLIEAMASGLCGVAPAAGGNIASFEHEKHGLFYKPLDAQSGADAIHRIITEFDATNPSAPIRKSARAKVEAHSWRTTYVEAESQYRELVANY
jgi:glycosyltransferase involved in cell wall biosynthesis